MSELLALRNVAYRYPGAHVDALTSIDVAVPSGQGTGIVGESGSGKSTALRLMLGLARPSGGEVLFDGQALEPRRRDAMRSFRRRVQVVFQDPYSSLDPRQRVGCIIAEPLVSLGLATSARAAEPAVTEALASVELQPDAINRYPHQFSGGERQRIAIARALVTNPDVLLADEPVSALDVSTRIGVIRLLDELRRSRGLTLVLVSHDISVVAALCDRIVVLKDGTVAESGGTAAVLREPRSSYTRYLLDSIPRLPELDGLDAP